MARDERVGSLIAHAIDGQAQSITLLLEAIVGLREDVRALREDLIPVVAFAKTHQEREEASEMDARVAAAVAAQVAAIKAADAPTAPDNSPFFDRKTIAGSITVIAAIVVTAAERLLGGPTAPAPVSAGALPMDDAPTVLEALDEAEDDR